MVASEATPFAKSGGLADVLGSLPPALARLGDEVAVLIPRYRSVPLPAGGPILTFPVSLGPRRFDVAIFQTERQGVRYFFADCPPLYDRPALYGEAGVDYPDNHIRYAVLNWAAIRVARFLFRPTVIHAHDWQTGMLFVYLRENLASDPTFSGIRLVFTIHNLGYQGNFPPAAAADIGVNPALIHPEGMEFFGQLSFMKAGIVWSDAVNTVSPTYAREIQTPEFGFGMDGLLRSRASKLSGILNGVDYQTWDPETDQYLPTHYSMLDLSGKRACKKTLLEDAGLPLDSDRPVLGIVSRFADQKGMDLVVEVASRANSPMENASLVVLGSGDPALETEFLDLAKAHPDRISVRIGYDDQFAHRIEAGADIFLMPSRYEPCGLNQIYSLRYGTVPVVRATGGLQDTVDLNTGFKFAGLASAGLSGAIAAALAAYEDRAKWTERVRRGMAKDFSWEASATEYRNLYHRPLASSRPVFAS